MRIDFDKPHSKYCGGIPSEAPKGTVYRQGTDYFSGKGDLIPKPEIILPLESRHWKQIKQEVEKFGGEFTTKAEGVMFLRERGDLSG